MEGDPTKDILLNQQGLIFRLNEKIGASRIPNEDELDQRLTSVKLMAGDIFIVEQPSYGYSAIVRAQNNDGRYFVHDSSISPEVITILNSN